MKSLCVFAGSSLGAQQVYQEKAQQLGQLIVEKGYQLVYGGSTAGLMGIVANACLDAGGQVIGVMPRGLFNGESRHNGLTQFIEADGMHARKAKMSELADGYIALPGGLGTFEELFEVLCWAQIGIHQKPIGLLNVQGYYNPLLQLIQHSTDEGFTSNNPHGNIIQSSPEPSALLDRMSTYQIPVMKRKWNTFQED